MLQEKDEPIPTDIKSFKLNNFIQTNAESLPFDDNSFDMVFGGFVLHHLNIKKVSKEIMRVLKIGGSYQGIEPNGNYFYIYLPLNLFNRTHEKYEHAIYDSDIKIIFPEKKYILDIKKIPYAIPIFHSHPSWLRTCMRIDARLLRK